MFRKAFQNRRRAFELAANVGRAFASRNLKAALSTLTDVIKFYHTEKGLYFSRFV